MSNTGISIRTATITAAMAVIYVVLMMHEQDYLLKMDKLNLFLSTPLFLQQHLGDAKDLVTYVACYFTQYFYRPWLGALVYCLWCGLMMWLTAKALRLPPRWSGLLLIPLACVLVDGFSEGYHIFYSREQGHMFKLVITVSLVMSVLWGVRCGAQFIARRLRLLNHFSLRFTWPTSTVTVTAIQSLILIATIGICYSLWYKDATFYRELRLCNLADKQDWQGIVEEASQQQGEPSRTIVALRNLALFKLGQAGDKLFTYPNGARKANAPMEVHVATVCGPALYLHYGMPNYCTRWCMEQGVKYGWRVEHLEYMTRAALLNKEYTVAKKYIGLLQKTMNHTWHPEPELERVRHLMGDEGFPGNDYVHTELFLVSNIARVQTNDPEHAELALLAAMQTRDAGLFWRAFFQYTALIKDDARMPRHYQEAAILFGHLTQQVDISRMPFDPEVVKSYEEFMQADWQQGTYYYYFYNAGNIELD